MPAHFKPVSRVFAFAHSHKQALVLTLHTHTQTFTQFILTDGTHTNTRTHGTLEVRLTHTRRDGGGGAGKVRAIYHRRTRAHALARGFGHK